MLSIFEVCAHPEHSTHRAMSAMAILDQIIRTLSLTFLDADDPNASTFVRQEVPRVRAAPNHPKPDHDSSPGSPFESISSSQTETCDCVSLSLGYQWSGAHEHTPLWLSTPAWDASWSDGEIRKESCRRLCWSTVILAAGHSSYTTASKAGGLDLFVTEPANVRYITANTCHSSDEYPHSMLYYSLAKHLPPQNMVKTRYGLSTIERCCYGIVVSVCAMIRK